MYLIPSDRKVLSALKKAQSSESAYVAIDYINGYAYHSTSEDHRSVEAAFSTSYRIKLKRSKSELVFALNYMCNHGLLEHVNSGPVYQVTSEGWRNPHMVRMETLNSIVTHVVFPSLVALITTLLTLFIHARI